jgi:hypothetical protein
LLLAVKLSVATMADTMAAQIEPALRFTYKPLESPDSIRLLLLEPPSLDSP